MHVEKQSDQWPLRTAGWHVPDYDPRVDGYPEEADRPSRSDLAAEQDYHYSPEEFELEGYDEPPVGEHGDPGFREEEIDDWHDPDHGREDHRHHAADLGFEQPEHPDLDLIQRNQQTKRYIQDKYPDIVSPQGGGGMFHPSDSEDYGEDYGPNLLRKSPPGRSQEEIRTRMERPSREPQAPSHKPVAPPSRVHEWKAEDFDNKSPTMDTRGITQPPGSIEYHPWFSDREMQDIRKRPKTSADKGPTFNVVHDNGARIIRNEESGLGYDVIAVPNPKGDGWDVVRELRSPSFPQE